MANIKFSINRETLVVGESEDYLLTRVPNSNMQYYWLLNRNDIVSSDDVTLIVECDSEKEISLLPNKGNDTPPDIKQAISEMQNPVNSVYLRADELYQDYYHYEKGLDPEQRAEMQRIRDQKREEALSRLEASKNMRQDAKQPVQNASRGNKNVQATNRIQEQASTQQQVQTPAQRMEQQRAQLRHYSKKQFKEILKCHKQKLNAKKISNVDLSYRQMRELRLSMKMGLDISGWNTPYVSEKYMKEMRLGAKRGVKFDIDKLDHSLYNAEQLHEYILFFEKGLDVKPVLNPAFNHLQIRENRLAQQAGLDSTPLQDFHMTAEQMRAVRHQMVLNNLADILKRFFERMKEIVSDIVSLGMEKVSANMQNRESRTLEEMKEATMQEAIHDIKYTLVESEILSTRAYEDIGIDSKIRAQIEDLVSYMENEPETDIQKVAEEAADNICQAVGAEINVPREGKVININRADKQVDNVVSAEQMNAISAAIDEELGQSAETAATQETVIEEESFEAMQ